MPRKKMPEEKSTVLTIRDNSDWGMSLFNACYLFNHNFALYVLEYADKYDKGLIKYDNDNILENLTHEREYIINEHNKLKDEVKISNRQSILTYRKYAKTLPIGKCVSLYRNNCLSNDYISLIKERQILNEQYHLYRRESKNSIIHEKEFVKKHKFSTRELGYRIKNLNKMINFHSYELSVPMNDTIQNLYNLLISEEQAEKLMGVCLNILNTYSEKEFILLMNNQDKEHIVDYIFNYFSTFKHNYDVIAGCYELHEDDKKLYMKNIETLKNKIYNGYYFTIRGFVQRSYVMARNEHFNIESADQNFNQEEDMSNHGIDKYINENSDFTIYPKNQNIGKGLIDYWCLCKKYLFNHIDEIADELLEKMVKRYKQIPYYQKNNMIILIEKTLEKINDEISTGHDLGNQLKHIILDSMGGAESKEEWKTCVNYVSEIIIKHMKIFFEHYNKYLSETK